MLKDQISRMNHSHIYFSSFGDEEEFSGVAEHNSPASLYPRPATPQRNT
jgi:hypothetical protein